MKKILLAVDGSESSKKAADKAAELASALKAELTLTTVIRTTSPTITAGEAAVNMEIVKRMEEEREKQGQKILEEAAVILEEKGISPEKELHRGDPADVICNLAEKENYDLVVIANKGRGQIKRFFLGSISDKVVRHISTSVLVVK